jgi:hypothetical protein
MEQLPSGVLAALLLAAVGVAWFLLRQKDAKQGDDIKALWAKHDADVKDLQELRLQIARDHYIKSELDTKFEKLESTFRDGLKDLGGKMEALTLAVTKHIHAEEKENSKC